MSLNNVAEDIRALLASESKGESGVDLFSFQWGSDVKGAEIDGQIMIMDNGQLADFSLKESHEQPSFTIYVRGETSESEKAVHDRARDIYEMMLQEKRQIINALEYVEFTPIGGLLPLGKDASNRVSYSMNFYTFRCAI